MLLILEEGKEAISYFSPETLRVLQIISKIFWFNIILKTLTDSQLDRVENIIKTCYFITFTKKLLQSEHS